MSTAVQTTNKKEVKYYIHSIIGLVLMFGIGFIPAIEPITPIGMKIIGIFVGMCYLWTTVEMLWPSVVCIFALSFTGYAPMTNILQVTFGAEAVWMSVFAMAIMAAIANAGLNDHIIAAFLGSKLINNRPWVFTIIFFIAVSVFCSCVNSTVGYFMFWAILADFAARFGYKKGDRYIVLMLIGVGAIGHMAANLIPFRGMPMVMLYSLKSMGGVEIDFLRYMCISIPLQIVFILAYVAMMRFIFRCDVTPISHINSDTFKKELPPMTKLQKFLLGYLVFFILALTAPSIIPKTTALGAALNSVGSVGIMMILFGVLALIRIGGEPILKFQKIAVNIYWEMPFLLAAAMGVSSILVSEATGVKAFLMKLLTPIFNGFTPVVFLIFFTLIAILLTNICNNLVIAFMMAPIAVSYAAEVAINLPAAITLLIYAVLIAFLLPAASATAAMLMTNPLIDTKNWFKIIIPVLLCLTLVTLGGGLPLCLLFY